MKARATHLNSYPKYGIIQVVADSSDRLEQTGKLQSSVTTLTQTERQFGERVFRPQAKPEATFGLQLLRALVAIA